MGKGRVGRRDHGRVGGGNRGRGQPASGEDGYIVQMEYGGILEVFATAADVDGYVCCMSGCRYSEYVVDAVE